MGMLKSLKTQITMSDNKNYCETHHFYYRGVKCPLCESERIQKMADKYSKKINVGKPKKEEREIREATVDDIQKLIDKFNRK